MSIKIEKVVLFLVIVCINLNFNNCKTPPSFVKLCKRNELDMTQCVKNSVNDLRPYLIKGIPEMGLRQMEPMKIKEISLKYGGAGNVQFNSVLSDLEFYGVKDFQLNNIDFNDIKTKTATNDKIQLKMDFYFPEMHLTSKYKGAGKFLLLAFESEGECTGNFTGVETKGHIVGKIIEKNNEQYLKITNSTLSVDIKRMQLYFTNLFANNEELTRSVNNIVNENNDIFFDELRPIIEEAIKTVVNDSIKKVYQYFSINTLFPSE